MLEDILSLLRRNNILFTNILDKAVVLPHNLDAEYCGGYAFTIDYRTLDFYSLVNVLQSAEYIVDYVPMCDGLKTSSIVAIRKQDNRCCFIFVFYENIKFTLRYISSDDMAILDPDNSKTFLTDNLDRFFAESASILSKVVELLDKRYEAREKILKDLTFRELASNKIEVSSVSKAVVLACEETLDIAVKCALARYDFITKELPK